MSTPHFSFNDLKKHIQTFEKLKTQIYVSDEVFRTLTGFCLMIQPTFTQLRQQDDFHRFTFLKTSFLKNCTRTEKDKIFLFHHETPSEPAIQTSGKMIGLFCTGMASVLENFPKNLKNYKNKKEYIQYWICSVLPEIKNGSFVRFNQMIELTRKTLIEIAAQDKSQKDGITVGQAKFFFKNNKDQIFKFAEQVGLIPSAEVLINYQHARDIVYANPGRYPAQNLSLSKHQKYLDNKGNEVKFNHFCFGEQKILENYEQMLCCMLGVTTDALNTYINQNSFVSFSTDVIEAGISIDYLEGSRHLRDKIQTPLMKSEQTEYKKDKSLRNRLEHAYETPKTVERLKSRQDVLEEKHKKLSLHYIYDLLNQKNMS